MNTPSCIRPILTTLLPFLVPLSLSAATTSPIGGNDLVFEEVGGMLAVEAEHFHKQTLASKRAWHITTARSVPDVAPDADPPHLAGASGGAYVEVLPDTRRTHDDKLVAGENFSDTPGQMAVLHYRVHFNTPGRYHVWIRAQSTGSEDNGVHVGLDGEWPESGRRWQTVAKNSWTWDSRQRTARTHSGEPGKLFLDIARAGPHEILFSLREDGFEMDKFILTTNRAFSAPRDAGPAPRVKQGRLPPPFPEVAAASDAPASPTASPVSPPQPDGPGTVRVAGELKQWHKVTLSMDGPFARETGGGFNPFTDVRMTVTFTHESGAPRHVVPGYFAADGDAANSSAESGTRWRAHLAPDKAGAWTYAVSFVRGPNVAVSDAAGEPWKPFDGAAGRFTIEPTDKTGGDLRARGLLRYVGGHHLRFAGDGTYFLKAGPDAPENLLAYADFDGTRSNKPRKAREGEAQAGGLKTWAPHVRDWREGDPSWKGGRGKGLVGALNYLAAKGCNTFSFLPYNAGGDGDDVWPFVAREDKLHYDCSKLDQWGIVFDHGTALGLHLHFKLQENEIDDNRRGHEAKDGRVPESLDGGKLGVERRLYCRELVARFAHNLALNWNLGEENTQSTEEIRDMAAYLRDIDPYDHPVVIHTFPNQQDKVYPPLLGDRSALTGASLQNGWNQAHQRTLKWVRESAKAGKPWVVANDEQNPADLGVPPDPGYAGSDGVARGKDGKGGYTMHDIRKLCLWGTLMAGGGGVEYYFGYRLPQNDLVCEDFRSRDRSWDYCRIALEFFASNRIPFWAMSNADDLVGNAANDNSRYGLARAGEVYVVYLPNGGGASLDLAGASGAFAVKWFNPRAGGPLLDGAVESVRGGGTVALGAPPADPAEDWVVVVRK